jgi:hypothetical protein
MDLLRDWRRRSFGALAGAAVVPAAILGAALAVGVGGGLGGIGSIGQALSGPELPAVAPGPDHGTGTAAAAGRVLARVRPAPSAPSRHESAAARPRTGDATTNAPGGRPRPGTRPGPGATPQPARPGADDAPPPAATTPEAPAPPAGAPSAGPAPAAPAPAPPTSAGTPSAIDQLGDQVQGITDQVPVAGEPAGEVVELLTGTLDGLTAPAGPH